MSETQPSRLSLIENEGEWSNCFSRNSKGLQSKTYNIIRFRAKNRENLPLLELCASDHFLSGNRK